MNAKEAPPCYRKGLTGKGRASRMEYREFFCMRKACAFVARQRQNQFRKREGVRRIGPRLGGFADIGRRGMSSLSWA